ncbi:YSIRK-type signal peptide-containing protein, partial [Staphylococcus schleiferi]|nr:YSIRK-type signal peptide-containing protein [Staphylococcus schleiferi]
MNNKQYVKRKQVFGIRKLSFGTGSALLTTLLFFGVSNSVYAAENGNDISSEVNESLSEETNKVVTEPKNSGASEAAEPERAEVTEPE